MNTHYLLHISTRKRSGQQSPLPAAVRLWCGYGARETRIEHSMKKVTAVIT